MSEPTEDDIAFLECIAHDGGEADDVVEFRERYQKAERERVLAAIEAFVEAEKRDFESGFYSGVLVDAGDLLAFLRTLRSEP